jgi:predicted RNA binding protein YcfA (HicA-like mRNA interferase family)
MQRRDLVKKLQGAGWQITHGGNHDLAIHPKKPGKIPIPRHNEINEYTAREIMKDAGLK